VICKNFWCLDEESLHSLISLPYQTLYNIVSNPALSVKNEYVLYNIVTKHVEMYKKDLQKHQIELLFSHIRFILMSVDEFEEVKKNEFVPSQFIIEALFVKLQVQEKGTQVDPNNPR
jgi:hypothetical protein